MNGVSGEECRNNRCVLPSFSLRALGGQVVRRLICDPISICICVPYYFGFKKHPTFKKKKGGGFSRNNNKFASKCTLLSVKFITFLVRPLVFRGKGRFSDFRRVKNNTKNLKRSLVFILEKCVKGAQ